MSFRATIGLEVHVQLNTRSKMFCGCGTSYGAEPNSRVCPVCLGYPGAMPTMNERAVRLTVTTGLMVGSRINTRSTFDRKSYFYPDMPKNYQISQYDKPLCVGGGVAIEAGDGSARTIRLRRIHLEEDVAKSTHFESTSGVDFNRAGVPLMEIVTEPDLHSPAEAHAFLSALKQIVQYAGVSECNLEEGNVRCDVNCSVAPEGHEALGTKTEIKNMNTFKGVLNALEHEIGRQIDAIETGERIMQETRRWDVDAGVTLPMRTKEEEHDYRYFPEPDLVPVVLTEEMLEAWRAELPELPRERVRRMVEEYGIPEYDAQVQAADRELADFFEQAARGSANPKGVSNWMMTDMLRLLSYKQTSITTVPIRPEDLARLVALVDDGALNSSAAREVFAVMFEQGGRPDDIVKERGLSQVSDDEAIGAFVDQAMAENEKSVADYKSGRKAALQYLVGQVMRLSRGKANPPMVAKMLAERMDEGAD